MSCHAIHNSEDEQLDARRATIDIAQERYQIWEATCDEQEHLREVSQFNRATLRTNYLRKELK